MNNILFKNLIFLFIFASPVLSNAGVVQPKNVTAIPGGNATFTIAGEPASSTYKWQVNINDGNGFIPINDTGIYKNSTTNALNISVVNCSMNNYKYRCIVTNKGSNKGSSVEKSTSDTVALSVEGCLSPYTAAISGAHDSFTVTGGSAPCSYQ